MSKSRYERVAELVRKLTEAVNADELICECDLIFGTASASRRGILYDFDFPGRESKEYTLYVQRRQIWRGGPELNEFVVAVTEQERRRARQLEIPLLEGEQNDYVFADIMDRALESFNKK